MTKSTSIIIKAVSKNFWNILRFYPKMIYMANHQEKYSSDERYSYCLKLIKLLIDTCNIKINVFGFENIPKEDGFYLCSNHQEKFDPLAIWYSFPRQIGVILNDKACHRPFIREVTYLIKSRRLIHSDMHYILNSFKEITEDLIRKENYMIFPEGDYETETNKLSSFHSGCFKSPQKAKCPILPVVLVDSYRIFDRGYKTTKPIQVHYLKPIMPEEIEGMTTAEISKFVKSKIQNKIDELEKEC